MDCCVTCAFSTQYACPPAWQAAAPGGPPAAGADGTGEVETTGPTVTLHAASATAMPRTAARPSRTALPQPISGAGPAVDPALGPRDEGAVVRRQHRHDPRDHLRRTELPADDRPEPGQQAAVGVGWQAVPHRVRHGRVDPARRGR